ncbi:hypothetical protein, partial [Tolypothrix sp. VBCCA 56010]|uniref:hypothetical protein n=1 Tax=Tolypothrix sp. VBCCA 56010 TaxID=3137731 RepID=UPI003D7CDF36
ITGKLRDTETVMRSLEGGGWKSANIGNSLAAYPTSRTVLKTNGVGDNLVEFNALATLSTNVTFNNPKAYRKAKKQLARLQRQNIEIGNEKKEFLQS